MKFRSKFEKVVYEKAKSNRLKLDYEPSTSVVDYVVTARYTPDFRLPNGILVEAKGYFDPAARGKMRRVKQQHPELDIRFVFQRASNTVTKAKNSKTYGQWAEMHGFPWAEGSIPKEWWKEI